jgi:hypothetical protein
MVATQALVKGGLAWPRKKKMRQRVNEPPEDKAPKELPFNISEYPMAVVLCLLLATVKEWDVNHSETSGNQHSIAPCVRFTFLWLTRCSDIAHQNVRNTAASNTTSPVFELLVKLSEKGRVAERSTLNLKWPDHQPWPDLLMGSLLSPLSSRNYHETDARKRTKPSGLGRIERF